jgi:hypothetical protein
MPRGPKAKSGSPILQERHTTRPRQISGVSSMSCRRQPATSLLSRSMQRPFLPNSPRRWPPMTRSTRQPDHDDKGHSGRRRPVHFGSCIIKSAKPNPPKSGARPSRRCSLTCRSPRFAATCPIGFEKWCRSAGSTRCALRSMRLLMPPMTARNPPISNPEMRLTG